MKLLNSHKFKIMFRTRALSVLSRRGQATLPDLPYEYHALEPFISADIMELHHSKHHATYVNNLNVANAALIQASNDGNVTKCIQLAQAIKFNGGGHLNHTIFWQVKSLKLKWPKRFHTIIELRKSLNFKF